jgi:hypothetical protein
MPRRTPSPGLLIERAALARIHEVSSQMEKGGMVSGERTKRTVIDDADRQFKAAIRRM